MTRLGKLFILCGVMALFSGTAFAAENSIVIASGGSGGTYYYIGAGMAKLLSEKLGGVSVTTEATSGSPLENGSFTSQSPDTMGMFTLDGAYAGLQGDKNRGFRKPLSNLRMVLAGHHQLLYWATLDSKITNLAQLKGKRIGVSPIGQSTYYQALISLEAYGLKSGDYKAISMTYAEQADALKDGNIDIMGTGGGIPQAALMDVSTTHDTFFLEVDPEKREELVKKYPYWWFVEVPANTYNGQTKPFTVFASQAGLFANADMSEDLVYRITKTLCESNKELSEIHAEGGKWSAENTKRLWENPVVPFHPGALRYFDELWKK